MSDKKEVIHSIYAAIVMVFVFVICAYGIAPLFFKFMDWFGFNFVPSRMGGGSEIGNEGLLQLVFRGALALIASVSAGYFAGDRLFPDQNKKHTFIFAGTIITVFLVLFFSYPSIKRLAYSAPQQAPPAPMPTSMGVIQHPLQSPVSSAHLLAPKAVEPHTQSAPTIKRQIPKKIKHYPQPQSNGASETHCINNCFVFEAYHDEGDPDFKPFRITMDSVGVRRIMIYRTNSQYSSGGYQSNNQSAKDLDYYLNQIPKTVRDLAPMKALRLAREMQNSDRGIHPSQEEQAINRLNDKLNTIKTNQFNLNQKIDETNRRLLY